MGGGRIKRVHCSRQKLFYRRAQEQVTQEDDGVEMERDYSQVAQLPEIQLHDDEEPEVLHVFVEDRQEDQGGETADEAVGVAEEPDMARPRQGRHLPNDLQDYDCT